MPYRRSPRTQADAAKHAPLNLIGERPQGLQSYRYPYFTTYVTHLLESQFGSQATFEGGLQVYTSLDPRQTMEGAARQGGMSQVHVLLARRHYQEVLLESTELVGDAYDAALKIRQTAALFPRPLLGVEEAKR